MKFVPANMKKNILLILPLFTCCFVANARKEQWKVIVPQVRLDGVEILYSYSPSNGYYQVYDGGFSEDGYVGVEKDGKWGLVDTQGKVTVPLIYDHLHRSDEDGLVRVRQGDKWGIVNIKGEEIIPITYDDIGYFEDGQVYAQRGDKWGVVNTQGEEIVPFIYDSETSCSYFRGEQIAKEAGYDDMYGTNEGVAIVRRGDKYGVINTEGEEILPLIYDFIGYFDCDYDGDLPTFIDGLAKIYKGGKWGIVNTQGEMVVPLRYGYLDWISDELVEVEQGGKSGIVNLKGEVVAPFIYDGVFNII